MGVMTTVIANKMIGGIVLLIWGFAGFHFDKVMRKQNEREFERIRSQYQQSPIQMGLMDSLFALLGSAMGPRIVAIFYAPLFNWILIVIGGVAVIDAIYLSVRQ